MGHATEIAKETDLSEFDAILCVSGDGIVNGENLGVLCCVTVGNVNN